MLNGSRFRAELVVFAGLLAITLAADYSVYVASTFHLYVHDLTCFLAGVLGLVLAVRRRSPVPGSTLLLVPLALFVFVLANTVALGAVHYGSVPPDLRKLFWFEHGDAVRIVGELLAWTWTLGLLRPTSAELWQLLDLALWGGAVSVLLTAVLWQLTFASHAATTNFDLIVMVGLPLAMVTAARNRARLSDLVRIGMFGLACFQLYSRTAIIAVAFTSVVILVALAKPRRIAEIAAPVIISFLLVLAAPPLLRLLPAPVVPDVLYRAVPLAAPGIPADASNETARRAASIIDANLAPYTIPARLAIWRDALRISKIQPLFGVGYHDYFLYSRVSETKNPTRFDPPGVKVFLIKQAHNDYLCWLAEAGLLGLSLYLAFWVVLMVAGWRRLRLEPGQRVENAFAVALVVSLCGLSFFGEILIPRTPDWMPAALLWWTILAALLMGADRLRQSVPPMTLSGSAKVGAERS